MKVKLLDKLLDDLKHELWSDSFLGKNMVDKYLGNNASIKDSRVSGCSVSLV